MFNSQTKTYKLEIKGCEPFETVTANATTIVFEGAIDTMFKTFVAEFLTKASQYFSKELDAEVFVKRLSHVFHTDQFDLPTGGEEYRVSWIPAHVIFYPSKYEVHWTLVGLEPLLAAGPVKDDVPPPVKPSEITPRVKAAFLRQKIRQARMKCAIARLHVEQLAERYYSKYGTFDGLSDSDSELSSDSEFTPNEPPRKI
jgi:hypothetical protein